jgi:hypothetical protein
VVICSYLLISTSQSSGLLPDVNTISDREVKVWMK